jgi:hypothetical protein
VTLLRAGHQLCRYAKLKHAMGYPDGAYNLYTFIVAILCTATSIGCNATYQTRQVCVSSS